MTNEVHIVRTIFEALDEVGNVVSKTYGARVYDDFGNTYVNFLNSREELIALVPADLIDHVKAHNAVASEMLSEIGGHNCLFVDGKLTKPSNRIDNQLLGGRASGAS